MYDLIVIGAGPGGYPAALEAAALGKRVAVVEQNALGGTCLNRGCIPTKTLLHSSALYHECNTAARFGVQCDAVAVDYPALWAHKDATVASLRGGIAQHFKKSKIDHIAGRATVLDAHTVSVVPTPPDDPAAPYDAAPLQLEGEYLLIATGSAPAIAPIPGVNLPNILTSDDVFDRNLLGTTPETPFGSVIVIGGGVIGMEMTTIYTNLGCRVTVLEGLDRILATLDKEIAQNLKMILKKRGATIVTGAMVQEITAEDGGQLTCHYTEKGQDKTVTADGILLSTGRSATTNGLFAPALGAQLQFTRGYLDTDAHFQTAVPSIYAIGDVRGKTQLAHIATAEGAAAIAAMFGQAQTQNLSLVPACVYTDPEIASVGLSADEAKAAGTAVVTGKYIMSVNGKSVLSLQERGFIKLVADADSRKLLGAQLMCARATDMIGEITIAIANELTVEQMRAAIRPHPTFAEGIGEALAQM